MPESSSPAGRQIAFVTVCKGRLHHLQAALPPIVAQAPDEIAVVDYDCPERAGDWVEANFPNVRAVRAGEGQEFNLARGRNIGARATSAPWLCFLDADTIVSPGFVEWLRRNLRERHFYQQSPLGKPLAALSEGLVICHRNAFDTLNGYDEVFQGWGGEDSDFYDRLMLCNVIRDYFPSQLVSAIAHGEEERTRFYPIKRREAYQMRNRAYRIAKHQVMHVLGVRTELAMDVRRQIFAQIAKAFAEWMEDPAKPAPSVTISMSANDPLSEPYQLRKQCSFTITLQ